LPKPSRIEILLEKFTDLYLNIDPVQPHSAKSVQFDLNPKERSPDGQRERDEDKWRDGDDDGDSDRGRRSSDHRRGSRPRDGSPTSGNESDTTIELPPRFDERGRRRDDDPLASKLENVLSSLFR
jgi:hypothetical protein